MLKKFTRLEIAIFIIIGLFFIFIITSFEKNKPGLKAAEPTVSKEDQIKAVCEDLRKKYNKARMNYLAYQYAKCDQSIDAVIAKLIGKDPLTGKDSTIKTEAELINALEADVGLCSSFDDKLAVDVADYKRGSMTLGDLRKKYDLPELTKEELDYIDQEIDPVEIKITIVLGLLGKVREMMGEARYKDFFIQNRPLIVKLQSLDTSYFGKDRMMISQEEFLKPYKSYIRVYISTVMEMLSEKDIADLQKLIDDGIKNKSEAIKAGIKSDKESLFRPKHFDETPKGKKFKEDWPDGVSGILEARLSSARDKVRLCDQCEKRIAEYKETYTDKIKELERAIEKTKAEIDYITTTISKKHNEVRDFKKNLAIPGISNIDKVDDIQALAEKHSKADTLEMRQIRIILKTVIPGLVAKKTSLYLELNGKEKEKAKLEKNSAYNNPTDETTRSSSPSCMEILKIPFTPKSKKEFKAEGVAIPCPPSKIK